MQIREDVVSALSHTKKNSLFLSKVVIIYSANRFTPRIPRSFSTATKGRTRVCPMNFFCWIRHTAVNHNRDLHYTYTPIFPCKCGQTQRIVAFHGRSSSSPNGCFWGLWPLFAVFKRPVKIGFITDIIKYIWTFIPGKILAFGIDKLIDEVWSLCVDWQVQKNIVQ